MNEIIPAVIPENFADLENHLSRVSKLVKTVQIDILDGSLHGRAAWPYKKNDNTFEKILEEEEGMPFWSTLNYEIHLMVQNPEEKIDQWLRAGAERIVVHPETTRKMSQILSTYKDALQISIALNLNTPIESVREFLGHVNHVQLMGIQHVGYQGEPLDCAVLGRITELRRTYPDHIISIDGGVTLENAKDLIDAGANNLVVGSAIFMSENVAESVRLFKQVLQ
jgi:ribulose-phosphate 3-epimerase